MNTASKRYIEFVRSLYSTKGRIGLHEPVFFGNEKKYLSDAIDSTFVSSVGPYVEKFEEMICNYTGSPYAVATTNGTSALHISLICAGVEEGDEVITQPLSFVATCNAIAYLNASPIFVDIDKDTLGLCPKNLKQFLNQETYVKNSICYNKKTKKAVKACVPMHTFGHICRIKEIVEICKEFNIEVIEDAAESLGSQLDGRHAGTFGSLGIISFNGNKIVTCGGGGIILTNNEDHAKRAKDLSTTSRKISDFQYFHSEVGFNYRLPNINAALGCAQLEQIGLFLNSKRKLANDYQEFFSEIGIEFLQERANSKSNYWLNTIFFTDEKERMDFLSYTNENMIETRGAWVLLNKLDPYKACQTYEISNAESISKSLVNIPSSVIT
tara:strand:- start:1237 stop:2385 length:1149 start_codon:yes stop_codon:yes gene_type:complete